MMKVRQDNIYQKENGLTSLLERSMKVEDGLKKNIVT